MAGGAGFARLSRANGSWFLVGMDKWFLVPGFWFLIPGECEFRVRILVFNTRLTIHDSRLIVANALTGNDPTPLIF